MESEDGTVEIDYSKFMRYLSGNGRIKHKVSGLESKKAMVLKPGYSKCSRQADDVPALRLLMQSHSQ